MNKDQVNSRNSRTWVKMNEDSKSGMWRNKFVAEHGGEFIKKGRFWEWQTIYTSVTDEVIEQKPMYEFKDSEGKTYLVDNLMKFCREHELKK